MTLIIWERHVFRPVVENTTRLRNGLRERFPEERMAFGDSNLMARCEIYSGICFIAAASRLTSQSDKFLLYVVD